MSTCYLDGQYLPLSQARISPLDRGFLFGDGIYEVIPVYGGHPFRLDEHLARLAHTLNAVGFVNPYAAAQWQEIIRTLVAHNPWPDQSVYLQITRGAAPVRNHAFPQGVPQTVFLMSEPLVTPSAQQRMEGVKAISAADIRWLRCDLKVVSLLANCLLRQQAVAAGCAETILFRDGFLTEGAASSIFVGKGGALFVPPPSHLMLPGITYDVIIELAARHQQPLVVREVTEAEVREADELWMVSSTKEVLPIVMLDGRPVGSGRPGLLAEKMYDWYQIFKQEVMYGG